MQMQLASARCYPILADPLRAEKHEPGAAVIQRVVSRSNLRVQDIPDEFAIDIYGGPAASARSEAFKEPPLYP
jgi:hypothetical protein